MKNLLFSLLLAMPLFCLSQTASHTVTTTDGKTYSGEIESYLGKKIVFTKEIPELGDYRIPIEQVAAIDGYIKSSRKNAIKKGNPNIVFTNSALETLATANGSYNFMVPDSETSSAIRSAAVFRLTGAAVGFGSLALHYGGAFDDMDYDTTKTIMTVSLASAAACFIIGEITLISATKRSNSTAMTLTGSSSGLGVAINF